MNQKSNVYTRSGDTGETRLVSSTSVSKGDPRIELYGEVDELNSFIGLMVSEIEKSSLDYRIDFLQGIQSKLFNLGSILACEVENREKYKLVDIAANDIGLVEKEIDRIDGELAPLKSFILPGGGVAGSLAHVCRTVCRRVERKAALHFKTAPGYVTELHLKFLNRLSDYFFVLGRNLSKLDGKPEVLWKP